MNENLMNFKLILDQADMELKIAARGQETYPEDYTKAKGNYVKAYYTYIDRMNDFCAEYETTIKFDLSCNPKKYDQ